MIKIVALKNKKAKKKVKTNFLLARDCLVSWEEEEQYYKIWLCYLCII